MPREQWYTQRIVKSTRVLLLFSFVFLVFLGGPKRAAAIVIFEQLPPGDIYNGAILNTPQFVSFGCTLNLNCDVTGQTAHRVGVWMKKIGAPGDIRLAVVDNWGTVASDDALFSNSISADSLSDAEYVLTWFDFPEGVVIGEQYAMNQFFQFQFTDANGTYNATDHYRVLHVDTNSYSAPMQWCKTGWGCASSQFYWTIDDGKDPPPPLAPISDPANLSASISPSGDVPPVSIECPIGHNYTMSLVHRNGDSVEYSFGVVDRQYCRFGTVSFAGFNLNTKLTTSVDSSWWQYIHTPLEYIIKDTTEPYLYSCDWKSCPLVNLQTPSNGYDRSVYLASSTYWTTAGVGPVFDTTDHVTWFNLGASTTTPAPSGFSNVLFLPGLEASRLYMQDALFENKLWEPNRTADVEKLYLDENGENIEPGVYTRDVIDEAFGFNIYKKFMESLDALVADNTIAEWRAFPYDWRRSIADVVQYGTSVKEGDEFTVAHLADELIDLASTSKSGKVTIIGHSNGGLVGKLLIDELARRGQANLVDTFIMAATPQLGTPAALAGMLHGDEQMIPKKFGVILDKGGARQFAENMPGAYGLLPSGWYFSEVFDPMIEFDPDVSAVYDFPFLYGDSIDSKNELDSFLLGESGARTEPPDGDTDSPNVLNESLLARASAIQHTLDSWTVPAGIKVVQIVGWGLDTVRGIRYDDCDILLCPDTLSNLDRELLFVDDGDGTVVVPSANAMEGAETYYVNLPRHNFLLRRNREHADILEVEPVQDLISSIVQGSATSTLPNNITPTKPISDNTDKHLRFRIHSPVSLDLYDAEGNHTGPVATTSDFRRFEAEIPNSYYTEFGEVKYAGADASTPVTVDLIGQSVGTFTLEIEEVLGNEVSAESVFTDIPVVVGTNAVVEVADSSLPQTLILDIDNDGINDATVGSGEGISAEELISILRGMLKTLGLSPQQLSRIDKIFDRIDRTLAKSDSCTDKKQKDKCLYTAKQSIDRTFDHLSVYVTRLSQDKEKTLSPEEAAEVLQIINRIRSSMGI